MGPILCVPQAPDDLMTSRYFPQNQHHPVDVACGRDQETCSSLPPEVLFTATFYAHYFPSPSPAFLHAL